MTAAFAGGRVYGGAGYQRSSRVTASRAFRPPFRGGAVNMDARHIKLDEQPVAS